VTPSTLRSVLLAFSTAFATVSLHAQPSAGEQEPDARPLQVVGGDLKAYVTSPLHAKRKQWVRFGSALAAVGVAYHYDERVRSHFVADEVGAVEPDRHDTEDALPAALALGGTWLAAALGDNEDGKSEARAMIEAAALSVGSTYILKQAADRERPYESADPHGFGKGGDSFPSMHVAAAFAIGTVLAESGNQHVRWLRRTIGYGLAAATAYERMNHDAHWFSDTVAGAAVGLATARFVLKRRGARERGVFAAFPIYDGLALSYTRVLAR